MKTIIKAFFFLLPFFSAHGRPVQIRAETGHFETINLPEVDMQIQIPDFSYFTEKAAESTKYYRHKLHPHRILLFTEDYFIEAPYILLTEYMENFCQNWKEEDPSFRITLEEKTFSVINGELPIGFRKWECSEGQVHQFFFVKENRGYCFWAFCYPPSGIDPKLIESENTYWERLMHELPYLIRSE
ncbi:MAG: hypothetical protein P0S96_06390 [Simkaniaceae bacterium]|nr:hypothetical protein [Candidatus Sacchlamyda saccharinae]